MAKAIKKTPQVASDLFHNIMKASVSEPMKPHVENHIVDGRKFLLEIFQYKSKMDLFVYETVSSDNNKIIHKDSHPANSQPTEIFSVAKEWINSYVDNKKNAKI